MTTIVIDGRKIRDFGIGTYLRGLLGGLAELDRESRYVLLGDPESGGRLALPENFSWRSERSPGYSARELWSVSRNARAAGADLFHSPHYVTPLGLACPAVVTVHDLIHLRFTEHYTPLERAYARVTVARALRGSSWTIAVSEATRRELRAKFGALANRVETIPNGVDERLRAEVDADSLAAGLRRLGLEPGYLLFVGNPKPHKNLPLLLEAHARLRARREAPPLVLAGGAAPDPAPPAVRALGEVSDEDLPLLYRGALAVVVPSLWEGFGLPAAEAMASGTPVVASNRGALPEVVGDAGLLFDPEDAESLVAAIGRLVTDPALARRLAVAGRERSLRFSWTESARRTLEIYRRALAEEGRLL